MKNTITKMTVGTLSILLLIFSSCSEKKLSQKEMVKKNAEQYLKQRLDDPESYEFVELKFRVRLDEIACRLPKRDFMTVFGPDPL